MKTRPISHKTGWNQLSKTLSIITAVLVVTLLVVGMIFLINKRQDQRYPVTTPQAAKTPTVLWSSGIYLVTNKNWDTSMISKVDMQTHKVLWEYAVSRIHASSLTIYGNNVYYSTYNYQMSENAVYDLDADKGTLRWKTVLAGRTDHVGYLSQPVYSHGMLYMIAQSIGTVTALDANNGKVRWTYTRSGVDAGSTSNGQLTVSNGMVYGIIANMLFTLNADTGKELRNAIQIDLNKTFLSIQVVDDVLYVTSCLTSALTNGRADSYIYAFDAKQGTQRWLYHSALYIFQSIFSEEKVYFLTVDQSPSDSAGQGKMTISALNAKGRAIWHKDVLNNGIRHLAASNGLLYLGYDIYDLHTKKNTSYLRAFQNENGADAWIKQIAASPNLVQNGILYTGLAPCQLGAFNAQNGKELWHQQYCVPLDDRDRSTPDFVIVPE
jgi:outer membrane protein assembly factor BamB